MNDWIRLLVKYKGKCSICGKEISAGQYALWSKSSKVIRHNECTVPQLPATTEKRDRVQTGRSRRQQRLIALSAVGLSQVPSGGLRSTTTMADRQFRKRLSAIDVWRTRMPPRTISTHSLKKLTES